jgi:hypothetical protein
LIEQWKDVNGVPRVLGPNGGRGGAALAIVTGAVAVGLYPVLLARLSERAR